MKDLANVLWRYRDERWQVAVREYSPRPVMLYADARLFKGAWAIVRADGVVIAQSVGADVSALKAEAA